MEYLKPTKIPISKKFIIGFDTEDNSKGKVKQIGFFNGSKFFRFTDPIRALQFIYDMPTPRNKYLYLYAHNLDYDLNNLFRYRFDLIEYIRWNNFIISAKLKGKNILFLDSLNLARTSLEKIGQIIGLPKLGFDPDSPEYLKRDCEIVFHYVDRLQTILNNDYRVNLKYTIPSISFEIFLRHFLKHEIKRTVDQEIFSSYYGGRTEAFRVGKFSGDIQYSDVNSMYPYIMNDYFPDTGELKLVDSLEVPFGIAGVDIRVDDPIPLLPARIGSKVYFPRGDFSGVWTIKELKELPAGAIKKIHWIRGTDKGFPFFRDFVAHFYKLKNDATDDFYKSFYKLILNSLYGKFGERLQGSEFIEIPKLKNRKNFTVNKILGNHAIITNDDIFASKKSNPLWASYVTAGARVYLWKSLLKINKKAKLIYCDTDSIIYQGKPGILAESPRIGDFKTESFDSIHVKGSKFYQLKKGKEKFFRVKGIPVADQDIFFDFGIVTFLQPIRFRESLVIGNLTDDQAQKLLNYWAVTVRESITKYDKRKIKSGGSSDPLYYSELEKQVTAIPVYTLRMAILDAGGFRRSIELKEIESSFNYLFSKYGLSISEMILILNDQGFEFKDGRDLIEKIQTGHLSIDRNFKNNLLSDIISEPYFYDELKKEKIKKVKKVKIQTLKIDILHFGGLKKNKDIPNWFFKTYFYLFRKQGNTVDEMIDMLKNIGWNFNDQDDFFDKINSGYLNNSLDF